jgi:hypothetical protein
MKQLTYTEIEVLQYTLRMYMNERSNGDLLYPLHNKLIAMRAELEYPHNNIELSSEEIVNSL